jgi:hypothetical protein
MKKLTNFLSVSLVLFCLKTLVEISESYCKQNSRKIIKILALFMLILLLACSTPIKTYGQKTFVNKIYLQSAGGSTNYNGINNEVGIQAILKKNWSTTLSYHKIEGMTPKNQPSDYRPETGTSYFLYFPYQYTERPLTTKMNIYSFTAGKNFTAGRKIWFTTEAGISLVDGEKVTYRPSGPNDKNHDFDFTDNFIFFFLGFANEVNSYSNYSTSIENKTTIGGMFRTDFNWAFASFMGLGAGVFANFNSIQSPVGFNLKLTIGWMNREKKEKN